MPYLTMPDLAERWGISYGAVKIRRVRGQLPEPDMMLGRTPAWLEATIKDMEAQDGHTQPTTNTR